jgi:exosortase/archaeosortase family protein
MKEVETNRQDAKSAGASVIDGPLESGAACATREELDLDPDRRKQILFAARFALIAAGLFAVYCFPYAENGFSERLFISYLRGYALTAGSLLRLVEPSVVVSDNNVIGRFSMSIIKSCDAMEANILFSAAILAFPGAWRRKAVALVAGLAMLVAANLVRLCSLYYVGVYLPSSFEFMHVEVWPLLMMAAALGDFVFWVLWMKNSSLPSLALPGPDGHVGA